MVLKPRKKRQGGSPNNRTTTPSLGTAIARPVALASTAAPAKGVVRTPPKKGVVRPPSFATPAPTTTISPMPAPRTAASEKVRAGAESILGLARGDNRNAIYRAVMSLGDPTKFAKYQADPNFAGLTFTQDPNSIWAQLGRTETQGLEDIDVGANAGNTFFSSKRLKDRTNLSDEIARQKLSATTTFEDDLKAIASTLGSAEGQYGITLGEADQMDIDTALAQAPLPVAGQLTTTPKAPTYKEKAKAVKKAIKKKKK